MQTMKITRPKSLKDNPKFDPHQLAFKDHVKPNRGHPQVALPIRQPKR